MGLFTHRLLCAIISEQSAVSVLLSRYKSNNGKPGDVSRMSLDDTAFMFIEIRFWVGSRAPQVKSRGKNGAFLP